MRNDESEQSKRGPYDCQKCELFEWKYGCIWCCKSTEKHDKSKEGNVYCNFFMKREEK